MPQVPMGGIVGLLGLLRLVWLEFKGEVNPLFGLQNTLVPNEKPFS